MSMSERLEKFEKERRLKNAQNGRIVLRSLSSSSTAHGSSHHQTINNSQKAMLKSKQRSYRKKFVFPKKSSRVDFMFQHIAFHFRQLEIDQKRKLQPKDGDHRD